MFDIKTSKQRCDSCGKFMKCKEKGSSHFFVPDSYVSYEENLDYCKKCTEKHGYPTSLQSVNHSVCVSINT
jgi:uncharacterized protein with PIN domain